MKYDFETRVNRKDQGSIKWNLMYQAKPDVQEGVVPLSVADMEFKHPKRLIKRLKEHLDTMILGYTEATEEYKLSVKNWMKKRHNFDIETDWIVNTAGVVPAFFSAITAFTEPGDGVIIMTPVYYPFYNAIRLQGRTVVECPLKEEDHYYTMDLERFEELASQEKNKVLLFCSPHNPVGRVWKREELQALSAIIKKHHILLMSDEIHFDLIMPGYEHTVFQTVDEELADHTLTFTAPSKSFNLAGMGMSNIIIKNKELRERFDTELFNHGAKPFTALGYKSCQICYDELEDWLDEAIQVIDANQRLVQNFFAEKYPQITVRLMEGTYLLWVDFRALGMSPQELEKFMIEKAELFLDEGHIFGEAGEGYERFNLAIPTALLQEALDRLDRALQTL